MPPRATANATAPSGSRCTAWCSRMRPASSPTPRPAQAPSCSGSSRTRSTPSRSAAQRVRRDLDHGECRLAAGSGECVSRQTPRRAASSPQRLAAAVCAQSLRPRAARSTPR
jgi:hypothetical protein